jgi:hypothetical protein
LFLFRLLFKAFKNLCLIWQKNIVDKQYGEKKNENININCSVGDRKISKYFQVFFLFEKFSRQ